MKILVTGGTGFIGSHLIDLLLREGHHVVALIRESSDLTRLHSLQTPVQFFNISKVDLSQVFVDNTIDHVVHLATSYGREADLSMVYDTNVLFPVRLLELATNYGVQRFLNTDTFSSKDSNLDYLKAYHITKRQFREWGSYVTVDKPIDFVTMVLQHPYGPHDSSKKFMSFIIRTLLNKEPSVELTEGLQKRDLIHVYDVASAYLEVLRQPVLKDKVFEVGTGSSKSIRELIEQIRDLTANQTTELLFGALPTRSSEIMDAKADRRALDEISWEPTISLEKGLTSLIEWHRENDQ